MSGTPRLNCPNCGAPVMGPRCEYCGTLFLDFGALSFTRPTYIKMRLGAKHVLFRAIIKNMELNVDSSGPTFYAMNEEVNFVHMPPEYRLTFEAVGVPNENGLVFIESETPTLDASTQEAAGMERRAGA